MISKALFVMDGLYEFDAPFDVMDAAINRCLGSFVRGFIETNRKEVTSGSVIYLLIQMQLGGIGEIEIDKLSDHRTQVSLSGPRFATELLSPQQQKAFFPKSNDLINFYLRLKMNSKGGDQEILERRKEYWKNVKNGLSCKLSEERIWSDSGSQIIETRKNCTYRKRRGPNSETLEKIRKLANLRQSEIEKKRLVPLWLVACQRIGIDTSTARKNAPILRKNWSDKNFFWTEEQEDWKT